MAGGGGVPGKADDPVITSAPLSNKKSSAVAHSSNTRMHVHTRTFCSCLLRLSKFHLYFVTVQTGALCGGDVCFQGKLGRQGGS